MINIFNQFLLIPQFQKWEFKITLENPSKLEYHSALEFNNIQFSLDIKYPLIILFTSNIEFKLLI